MQYRKTITLLSLAISLLATFAAYVGIMSGGGPGPHEYLSVRGLPVTIYGHGIYQDMSAEVAPQGIAQDWITLCIAVPLLLISLRLVQRDSVRGRILLTGTLAYFLVTYLFYTVMGMFNQLFLVWVSLMGLGFYTFVLSLISFRPTFQKETFSNSLPRKFMGGFLMFSAITIAILWLSVVLPALMKREIPVAVEHYTTLIVQGLDLGILLPTSFLAGYNLYRGSKNGYWIGPVYTVFLTILMCALTAKVIAMGMLGYKTMPAILIIPVFLVISLVCLILLLKHTREHALSSPEHWVE
jgi:hypothetical protein